MSYERGWNVIATAKLAELLRQLPADSMVATGSSTGALTVMDAKGEYIAYIDLAFEERVVWKAEADAILMNTPAAGSA